jgi:hypothetical protein
MRWGFEKEEKPGDRIQKSVVRMKPGRSGFSREYTVDVRYARNTLAHFTGLGFHIAHSLYSEF